MREDTYNEEYEDEDDFDDETADDEEDEMEEEAEESGSPDGGVKKMSGPFFYIMLALAIVDDVLDILVKLTIIILSTASSLIPIVGTAIGLALSFFISTIASIFSFIVMMSIILYIRFNGVKFTPKRLARTTSSFIIELVPFINILPMTTTMLLSAKKQSTSKDSKGR